VANSPQAKKRAKAAEEAPQSQCKPALHVLPYSRNVVKAIEAKDLEKAQSAYTASSAGHRTAWLTKASSPRTRLARHKSRLNAHITLATPPGSPFLLW